MNIYVVVEGPVGEKRVYSKWITYANPELSMVDSISDVSNNNFIIISGGGYPNYFEVIEAGLNDVNESEDLDRLVIAVDSEDMNYNEKFEEIKNYVDSFEVNVDYRIVVQHFCLETWMLGNQVIIKRNPQDEMVKKYREFYDVLTLDPEGLPEYQDESLNRAQFSEKYLRKLLNEKYRNLTYNKSNPEVLLHEKFFHRVKDRFLNTDHISSFGYFLEAFM